jgi:hypothetical protein
VSGAAAPERPGPAASGPSAAWFADDRGVERRLKVTWHPQRRMFVLSVWHRDTCTATFRLPLGEALRLVSTLVEGLGRAAASPYAPREPEVGGRRAWPARIPHLGRWRRG